MSRTLQALQNQAEGLQDRREEIQQRINNFDLEKEIYNGSATAYNLGKASLSTAIGGERVQALELAAPLGIKGVKYLSARSGLTQAIADKYKAFRGSNIAKTVEDLKSRGQSAIDEAGENLGGGEGFSVENLSSAADKLANASAEDVAQGVFKNGFTTTRLGGIGNNLTQEVRQIGSGAYRNMTDEMKAALPKGTVDEDGIPYNPEYLSNENIRAGLQTGRFNIEGGQIKDSVGETPDFGAEPELLSDVGNVATGLRGGAPFSKAYGGLTRGSEAPSFRGQPQRTQRGLFDEQGNIDTSKLGDPYDERVGLGTEPEVSQSADFGRISQALEREDEARSFQPGRSTLGDVFRQDARITSSQATETLEPTQRVAPPEIEAARQQRLQEFREAGEPGAAEEEPSPFQQALQRASQVRPTPSQQARAPGSSKGKAPARQPEPEEEVSEEMGGSAEALEERLPASTGTTRTIDPETALADRPRGAYGTSQGRAQQRLAQPDPEPARAEPEITDEPLQQPRTITQEAVSREPEPLPEEASKEDAATEEATQESGLTRATNVADAKEVAEESETLGGDLAKETGLDAIAGEGGEVAAEEGGSALVPGFGEVLMAGIGAYQLIKSAAQSKQEESIKPPAQPQMPQSLGGGVAFDSAPVIDSSDYHNL